MSVHPSWHATRRAHRGTPTCNTHLDRDAHGLGRRSADRAELLLLRPAHRRADPTEGRRYSRVVCGCGRGPAGYGQVGYSREAGHVAQRELVKLACAAPPKELRKVCYIANALTKETVVGLELLLADMSWLSLLWMIA